MSGIVGILYGDSQPINPTLLQQMTNLMAPQGPDAQNIWSEGHVGFGHALLQTTWESENEQQPLGLNGKQQRLFCARDQFGIVPFYYTEIGNGLIFSNHLNCLRLHPEVSDRLPSF